MNNEMINKVFFSTMWDMYFLWKYEWKEQITQNSFEEEVKKHLSFFYERCGKMPDLKDPIKELFSQLPPRNTAYNSEEKNRFVEKYS